MEDKLISLEIFDTCLFKVGDSNDLDKNSIISNYIINKSALTLYEDGSKDKNGFITKFIFVTNKKVEADVLTEVLEYFGFSEPKVYVCSGDKANGEFFNNLKIAYNINIDLHCGSDYDEDVIGAIKADIKGFLITDFNNYKSSIPKLLNKKLRGYLVANEMETLNPYKQMVDLVAPSLYRLASNVNKKHYSRVLLNGPSVELLSEFVNNGIQVELGNRSTLLGLFKLNEPIDSEANKYALDYISNLKCYTLYGFLEFIGLVGYQNTYIDTNITPETLKNFIISEWDNSMFKDYIIRCQECMLSYIKSMDIQDNDLLVDIVDTDIPRCIETLSGIKLRSIYLLDDKLSKYRRVIESITMSNSDIAAGYRKDGSLLYIEGNESRSMRASINKSELIKVLKDIKKLEIDISKMDANSLLLNLVTNPSIEFASVNCEDMYAFEDGVRLESIVNYNEQLISNGYVRELYNDSYWKQAFKVLLRANKQLAYLERLL